MLSDPSRAVLCELNAAQSQDNMLPTLLGLLSMLPSAISESIVDNGWRPISREQANPREFIKTQVYANSPAWNTPDTGNIKLPDSREIYTEDFYPEGLHIQRKVSLPTSYNEETDESIAYKPSKQIELQQYMQKHETSLRKAKKMSNENYPVIENLIRTTDINNVDNEIERSKAKNNINNYAVTENLDNDVAEQTNIDEGYTPVKEEPKTLADDFMKILANYNIRSSDRLPNYSLSLRQNSRQSNKVIYVQVPIRVPLGYNTPDHLLVDPLLAVYLSHYGYYLPGSYGVAGNYRNIYGYSAANNIHNNKPFGSYKIYSDTDSSH